MPAPQVLIVDFGSQYTRLIARRVRELGVYCEVVQPETPLPKGIKAVIFSGSPSSANTTSTNTNNPTINASPPTFPIAEIPSGVSVLGICYGAQLIAQSLGGRVAPSAQREFGKATVRQAESGALLSDFPQETSVWMSHGDSIAVLPAGFRATAYSGKTIASYEGTLPQGNPCYGLQFHPEVAHTPEGRVVLQRFLTLSACAIDWRTEDFVTGSVAHWGRTIPAEAEVVIGLSGGVDSSVAALLLQQAIGQRLRGIFVDNGLLRAGEADEVCAQYKQMGVQVERIDAKAEFYQALEALTDPEAKRKAIGQTFITVFEAQMGAYPAVQYLAQGTIYSDVIESSSHQNASLIKSHHNVGGLPENMKLQVVEPLRMLFKDEVRVIGKQLGLPDAILNRHPFPGPGLGIRILGEITAERVAMLQEADALFITALREDNLYGEVWQSGAILLPVYSVGVMGDQRTYEQVIALRAVLSSDGMTAVPAALPHDFLQQVATTIINQVRGINRVVYDISSKPPATIEWE